MDADIEEKDLETTLQKLKEDHNEITKRLQFAHENLEVINKYLLRSNVSLDTRKRIKEKLRALSMADLENQRIQDHLALALKKIETLESKESNILREEYSESPEIDLSKNSNVIAKEETSNLTKGDRKEKTERFQPGLKKLETFKTRAVSRTKRNKNVTPKSKGSLMFDNCSLNSSSDENVRHKNERNRRLHEQDGQCKANVKKHTSGHVNFPFVSDTLKDNAELKARDKKHQYPHVPGDAMHVPKETSISQRDNKNLKQDVRYSFENVGALTIGNFSDNERGISSLQFDDIISSKGMSMNSKDHLKDHLSTLEDPFNINIRLTYARYRGKQDEYSTRKAHFPKKTFDQVSCISDNFTNVDVIVDRSTMKPLKKRFSFRMHVVKSEVFEDAVRNCQINSLELTYTSKFQYECGMFISVPVYKGGYLDGRNKPDKI